MSSESTLIVHYTQMSRVHAKREFHANITILKVVILLSLFPDYV